MGNGGPPRWPRSSPCLACESEVIMMLYENRLRAAAAVGLRIAAIVIAVTLTLLLVALASCTGSPDSAGTGRAVDSPSASAPGTQVSSPVPRVADSTPGPLVLGDDAARLIGSHRTMAQGHIQGVGDWNVFIYPEGERAGVGLQIGDATPTRGCCLTRLRSAAEPLAFIPLGGNDGILLVHIDADIERVRFDCVQCDDARGVISHIGNGRAFHVPQLAVLFIRANDDGGNDGTVAAIGFGRVDRDWVGLPPHCSVPKCPKGLAWGVLQRGITRMFEP
jgi:hypothetical protein